MITAGSLLWVIVFQELYLMSYKKEMAVMFISIMHNIFNKFPNMNHCLLLTDIVFISIMLLERYFDTLIIWFQTNFFIRLSSFVFIFDVRTTFLNWQKSAGSVMTKTVFYVSIYLMKCRILSHCIDQGIQISSNRIILVLSKTRNLLYVIHNTHVISLIPRKCYYFSWFISMQ